MSPFCCAFCPSSNAWAASRAGAAEPPLIDWAEASEVIDANRMREGNKTRRRRVLAYNLGNDSSIGSAAASIHFNTQHGYSVVELECGHRWRVSSITVPPLSAVRTRVTPPDFMVVRPLGRETISGSSSLSLYQSRTCDGGSPVRNR